MSNILSFDFERPTTLDYRDDTGTIVTAPIDFPAYEFDTDGSPLGLKWSDDSVISKTGISDTFGQIQGVIALAFTLPDADTFYIIDTELNVPIGANYLEFIYGTNFYNIYLNGTLVDAVAGSYDWSGLDSVEIGNFDGADQPPDGTYFRFFGATKSATQRLTLDGLELTLNNLILTI